jgi:LysR family transcriptional activator of mexEF-oprN operon
MQKIYGRDLDLNLLRVFVIVAEAGSVTEAAARLYLTQPALSAALKRLSVAVGVALFARQGRGLVLTARGQRLMAEVRPHLEAIVDAALSPPGFDPETSERTLRLGLSDAAESWLLPPLLRTLERQAPRMRIIVVPVQFRTLSEALLSQRVDLAISVADDLPAGTQRQTLFTGGFVCLFDPRRVRIGRKLTREAYLAAEHVIVSYNGDLRGIVEDMLGHNRRARCSVPSFHSVGSVVDNSSLLATVPANVAREIRRLRPHLRTAVLPFHLPGSAMELIWRSAVDDDDACRFLRHHITRITTATQKREGAKRRG